MRSDRVQSGLRPQGPEAGAEASGGQAADPETTEVRREGCGGASEGCAVVNAPAGKRLAPILAELVPVLRGHGELDIDEDTAVLLIAMSAATIDRRLAPARSTLVP